MKILPALILTTLSSISLAQNVSKDLSDLVKAERAFSQLSYDKGIAPAFIGNLLPTAILLQAGNEANGVASMKKLVPDTTDTSVVTWQPAFADISSAGDFGFTTGAVKIEKSKVDSTVVASWTYTSVWQKDNTGKWKLIFDLGGGTAINRNRPLVYSEYPLKKTKGKVDNEKNFNDVLALDEKYNSSITGGSGSFDRKQFSAEGRLHRSGAEPVIGYEALMNYNDKPNRVFNFKQVNGKIAGSGDLAYTYGKVEAVITENGKTRNVAVGYLRIWKKYEGDWKVTVDVIG